MAPYQGFARNRGPRKKRLAACLLGDWQKFSCDLCTAKPVLQKLNGCFTPVKRSVAKYAGHEFIRCPVTYIGVRELRLRRLALERYLESLGPRDRLRMPAKLYLALKYTEFLVKLTEKPDDDRN